MPMTEHDSNRLIAMITATTAAERLAILTALAINAVAVMAGGGNEYHAGMLLAAVTSAALFKSQFAFRVHRDAESRGETKLSNSRAAAGNWYRRLAYAAWTASLAAFAAGTWS